MEPIDQEIPTRLTNRRYIMQIDGAYYLSTLRARIDLKRKKLYNNKKPFLPK